MFLRGITPAHAGKTLSDVDRDGNKKDHPRACGENPFIWNMKQQGEGSPPRMRGKPTRKAKHRTGRWITPAHAGKTCSRISAWRGSWDHPRACGENLMILIVTNARLRITPAHAGKTQSLFKKVAGFRDHPRACGENNRQAHNCTYNLGSPPRMRGKPLRLGRETTKRGITPAHAGKTLRGLEGSRLLRDHPRACGENVRRMLFCTLCGGSPPRMRGKH